jgi:C-terminal processing protease CtpA/Prc
MTISSSHNNNMMTTNNHTISAFGSQLSPSIAPHDDDEEEDSIERRLYQDVYMRESQNNNMMYSMTLSHLIQPPTTTRTYNTVTNINATNNDRNSYNHNNGGRGLKEETIIIIAPKGKLGVVIDTPTINNINNNTGKTTMPIVHAIKDTCPIRSQIRVGDKLLAVDDEDVTYMTAVEVSRLIGRKCEQKERKLTIVRGGGGRGGVIY